MNLDVLLRSEISHGTFLPMPRNGVCGVVVPHPLSMRKALAVIPKDPAQANPLKGWNNAYHGTLESGLPYVAGIRG